MGGWISQSQISSQKILAYDTRGNIQNKKDIPDGGRSFFGCTSSSDMNRIVLAGGYRNQKQLGEYGIIYNALKNVWFLTDRLIIHKNSPSMCFTSNRVYIFAGAIVDEDYDDQDYKKVQYFQVQHFDESVRCNFVKNKSLYSDKYLLYLLNSRGGLSFHLGNERILLFGGLNNDEQASYQFQIDGMIIELKQKNPSILSQIKEPRHLATQRIFNNPGLFVNGKIFIDHSNIHQSSAFVGTFVQDKVIVFKSLGKNID